jgi:predicted nucleotidyltransferase
MALVYGQARDRQTAFLPSLKAGVSCLYEDELYKYAMGIASDLERCITPRYEIDLRILNDAPVEFQYEVVKTGRLLVARDEDTRVAFEAGVITKFLDLKYLYDRIDRALLARVGE